ncbi:hypothetical protein SAMN05878437_0182 [Vreelandella subglaciescola]|jgi:hypothetical protein|uniref:Uncharacterized protein n=1 Tax=Vreelandella subglaciescola TaxID=29571 RepID=A0A1M7EFL0_9GAMM|nr:hypothetical protein SAMN05878437_0182 [Halomonas subglaciescola]
MIKQTPSIAPRAANEYRKRRFAYKAARIRLFGHLESGAFFALEGFHLLAIPTTC